MIDQTQETAQLRPAREDHLTASYHSDIPLAEDTAKALDKIEAMLRGAPVSSSRGRAMHSKQ